MRNEVIDLLQSHRSIRKYKNKPIPDEILEQILLSAQWAPSSHNMQSYSIIVVKNKETKRKLRMSCNNQMYVEECPVFLVFCLEMYKHKLVCDMYGTVAQLNELQNLIVGIGDTALAAQNALIAARSYGLGGCMIGEIKRHPQKVIELLKLPPYSFPIMGMCLGYPDDHPWQKPRLPKKAVIHEECYNESNVLEGLKEYEKITEDYYTRRTAGKRTEGWGKQMAAYVSQIRNPHLKGDFIKQGFKIT